MKPILTLAWKDIRLQTRDYFGLFWIFVFPVLYALFFGVVFSGAGGAGKDGRALNIAVVDEEQSPGSKAFLERLEKSPALKLHPLDREQAREAVLKGKFVAYLVIESGFGDGAMNFGGPGKKLELGIDPARQADVGFLKGILMQTVFADMQELFTNPAKAQEMARKAIGQIEKSKDLDPLQKATFTLFLGAMDEFLKTLPKQKEGDKGKGGGLVELKEHAVSVDAPTDRPRSSFEITFPQSILWGMMGCVASFSISIVIERNQGTFLRLSTSPLTWHQVLVGKGLGCFLTSVFVIIALLTFATLALGVRLGNPVLLALAIASTAFCFTGLMMFFSTLGKTEAGVAGAGWGIMMPMAMIGGGMVPLLAMPAWMQTASNFSPVKWGIVSLEGAVWRGFSLAEMALPCAVLVGVGAVGFALGVWKLKAE